jgi:hypothetical protein
MPASSLRALFAALCSKREITLTEIIEALNPALLVLIGSLTALLAGLIQFRIGERARKRDILISKYERAYGLCQEIYDGHKREIRNAKKFLPSQVEKFIELRNHPGKEVSELKMIVKAYLPEIKSSLEVLDSGHTPLKKLFKKIDMATNDEVLRELCDYNSMEKYLENLGKGSNQIKSHIEKTIKKLVRLNWV